MSEMAAVDPPTAQPAALDQQDSARPRAVPERRFSPLTLRILAVNVLALGLLAIGLLFLDRYQLTLIDTETASLMTHGQLIANTLGDQAVDFADDAPVLSINQSRSLLVRLAGPLRVRAQLFASNGQLLIDTSLVVWPGGQVTVLPLPAREAASPIPLLSSAYNWVFKSLPRRDAYPLYHSALLSNAGELEEGRAGLAGEAKGGVYRTSDGRLVFNIAMPIQSYRQVLGVLMLSRDLTVVDEALRSIRLNILIVFCGALAVTVLLSIYLAGTIARPIRRLAAAADRTRVDTARLVIPDFTHRGDEIGDLSAALRAMTEALWQRMEAIERFAADVAHEIKNPLTSLRSAVETAARVQDPQRQRDLLAIVLHDIKRLDRLISDISSASRLDAELARAASEPVDLGRLLAALVEVHQATSDEAAPVLRLDAEPGVDLSVVAIEDRLLQVVQNLIANAVSFSPPGGLIRLIAQRHSRTIRVLVEDDGPGIPEDKRMAIFDRFYTERPKSESFGNHSGLGLSIARQIAQAHGGDLAAENRIDGSGQVLGARFVLTLPAARPGAKGGSV